MKITKDREENGFQELTQNGRMKIMQS